MHTDGRDTRSGAYDAVTPVKREPTDHAAHPNAAGHVDIPEGPSVMRTLICAPALLHLEGIMRMMSRILSAIKEQPEILLDRAKLLRDEAQRMPPGVERDRLIRQARAIEAEANAEAWANSPACNHPREGGTTHAACHKP